MTSVMGGAELDLREAKIAPGTEGVVDIFALMGGAVLIVPADWVVDVQAIAVMGGIHDRRLGRTPGRGAAARPPSSTPDERRATSDDTAAPVEADTSAPRLVVRGFIMMGGLTIKP